MVERGGWLALSLAMMLVLGACGGGATEEPSTVVEVTASDFSFDPDTWVIRADTPFQVTLVNNGNLLHEWVILSGSIAAESEFSEDLVVWEMEAEAGASVTTMAPALEAGTYQVICAIPGHFSAGMVGELRVSG